jgi:hypothetical protein
MTHIPVFTGNNPDGDPFATTVTCAEASCSEPVDVSSTGLTQAQADSQMFFHEQACYDAWEAAQ